MAVHGAPRCLVVAVNTRRELDVALNEAVDLLKLVGMAEQVGISVTRLSPGRYEACLNSDAEPKVSCLTSARVFNGRTRTVTPSVVVDRRYL